MSQEIIEKISGFVAPLLEGTDMFIVSVKVKPTNNIKVFLDADSGLSIDKCINVNRKLYKLVEESGMFPEGDFSLEVSSPGVDEPLTSLRQYRKNIGRTLCVHLQDGSEVLGVLKEAGEAELQIEVKIAPKKKETKMVSVPFAQIKTSIVQIVF